jgi:hypothetical protein
MLIEFGIPTHQAFRLRHVFKVVSVSTTLAFAGERNLKDSMWK